MKNTIIMILAAGFTATAIAVTGAVVMVGTAQLLSGCAPLSRCRTIVRDGKPIEICERTECRDLTTGRLTECPK